MTGCEQCNTYPFPPSHNNYRECICGSNFTCISIAQDHIIQCNAISSRSKDDKSTRKETIPFLSSLSTNIAIEKCIPEALPYIMNFSKTKRELASRLYSFYNTGCFDNALPEEMAIKWNPRLSKTAGRCYSRRDKNGVRRCEIELSTKVINSADRLRDTLIHELCHAACWIISGSRGGHGPLWRTWTEKAMSRFPELPPIARCHTYQTKRKYSYTCEKCGYTIGRDTMSLNTERKVCAKCFGGFQLRKNMLYHI